MPFIVRTSFRIYQILYNRLLQLNDNVTDMSPDEIYNCAECTFTEVVDVLLSCSRACIPSVRKNLQKFWWNAELSELKNASIQANNLEMCG